jgi:hypothetical protein
MSLTRQVALLSLVLIAALGLLLAHVLRGQIAERTLADAGQSARLIARVGIQPRLSRATVRHGLSARAIRSLDEQLRAPSVAQDLARIKIWNSGQAGVFHFAAAPTG